MDQMNTKPTVIEGCVASYDNNGSTFCPAPPGVADILASFVIDDKAVPLSVVVERANDALNALRPLRSLCRTNCADDEDEGHLDEVERILKALITL